MVKQSPSGVVAAKPIPGRHRVFFPGSQYRLVPYNDWNDRPNSREWSAWSAASAFAISSATSACSCASSLPACSYDSALCRLALAWIFVPSRPTVPSFSRPVAGQQQYLYEQALGLRQKPPPERRDRVVVRMLVRCDVAERHAVIGRALQLAAGT